MFYPLEHGFFGLIQMNRRLSLRRTAQARRGHTSVHSFVLSPRMFNIVCGPRGMCSCNQAIRSRSLGDEHNEAEFEGLEDEDEHSEDDAGEAAVLIIAEC